MFESLNIKLPKDAERRVLAVIFTAAYILNQSDSMFPVDHAEMGLETADKLLEKLKTATREKP